jgi:hypothetical protein
MKDREGPMAIDTASPRSRRAILAAAIGGLGVAAAQALGRPTAAIAANDDPVLAGNTVDATVSTIVENTDTGVAPAGTGLIGRNTDTTPTDDFELASHKTGVIGTAGVTTGIVANTDETGVFGYSAVSANSTGVWGDSDGVGVAGTGSIGVLGLGDPGIVGIATGGAQGIGVFAAVAANQTGLYGHTGAGGAPLPPAAGIGVYARAETFSQTALQVVGKTKFSRSGRLLVGAGKSSVARNTLGVTASSIVFAVLQTAETGVWVRAAVPGTGKFTVYFNKALTTSAYVGWWITD